MFGSINDNASSNYPEMPNGVQMHNNGFKIFRWRPKHKDKFTGDMASVLTRNFYSNAL